VDGREMLMDFVRGAMGDKTMLIRSSMMSMSNSSVEGELEVTSGVEFHEVHF
jgi:hypothetical protein